MKTCTQCGGRKSDKAFPADGRTKDNLSHVCAECRFGDSNDLSEDETRSALREFGLPDEVPVELLVGLVETARSFAQWSSSFISGLPDSSFAYIEPGQEKDADGKTTPRSARHFPYKDADGNLDLPHINNALSRVEQWKTLSDGTDVTDALRSKVRAKLQAAQKKAGGGDSKKLAEADTLETVTLERVPILSEGGPYYGTGSPPEGDYYDKADLQAIADANRELAAEVKAANKLGHSKTQRLLANSGLAVDEHPAAGWLPGETFRVEKADDGKWKLYADIVKVPGKLAKLFTAGAFRTRSVELSRVTSQEEHDGETGKVFESVVTGLAWLGAKAPAVRTLDDIVALYGEATERDVVKLLYADADDIPAEVTRVIDYASADIVWEPEDGFQDVMNDLRAALNPGGGESRYWVQDVSRVLDKAIVTDWSSNVTWIVPITMNADGDPVPAPANEWTLAEQAWVAASNDLAERNFAGPLKFLAAAADTDSAMTEIKKISEYSDEEIVALAKVFGFDGDDAAVLRPQVAEQIKALAADEPAAPAPADPPAPAAPAAQDDAAAREMAELRRDAELGRKAFEDRRIEKRELFVTTLLGANDAEPRIQPAQADGWRKFYDENPELAEAQAKTLPVLATRIFGADDDLPPDVSADDAQAAGEDAWNAYADATGVPRTVNA